jgi:hypothetical protein
VPPRPAAPPENHPGGAVPRVRRCFGRSYQGMETSVRFTRVPCDSYRCVDQLVVADGRVLGEAAQAEGWTATADGRYLCAEHARLLLLRKAS